MSDTLPGDEMETRAAALLTDYRDEFVRGCNTSKDYWWRVKPTQLDAWARILEQDRRFLAQLVCQALAMRSALSGANIAIEREHGQYHQMPADQRQRIENNIREGYALNALASQLCRRALPFTAGDILIILRVLGLDSATYFFSPSALPFLRAIKPALEDHATFAACRAALEALRVAVSKRYHSAEQRDILRMLDELFAAQDDAQPVIIHSDEWGDQARPLLEAMDAEPQGHWQALLRHCATAHSSAPTAKWLSAGRELRVAVGLEAFATQAAEWLECVRKSANKPPVYDQQTHQFINNGSILDERNADLLRGLIWLCADVEDARLAAALGDGVIAGYRKITGRGPRCAKVAGACVYALQRAPNLSGAAHLERARLNVKQPQYVRSIERALDDAANAAGVSREDLEELTVPTFGLQGGSLSVVIGPATAELKVVGADVALHWRDAAGKPRKAEPAEVKRDHKAEVKDLKRLRDDLAHMLAAQSARLERLPLAERHWPLAVWVERYLEHPLVGLLTRRLIWRFEFADGRADGAWLDGALVGVDDQPLALPDDTTVTTWHPVGATAAETLAWRDWLERHTITQPFKQAHREVYLLTDAERNTRVYSNRFAGHILRQHQFNALCAARGWRNKLRLMVDDAYPPASLELPRWNLRAEFWVEGAGDEYEVDTNSAGTYLRLSTDQVRFHHLKASQHWAHAGGGGYYTGSAWQRAPGAAPNPLDEPVPLEEISLLVLSEVLRDVDLFVGVASVGADPTWQDGGPQGRYHDYWQSYSFGELSASGEQRRQLLERLLPRLAIASRCTLDGRFLRVRGDLREYKIHLGSGNILMEPNDQYLCIVPSRGSSATSGDVYLPFEGDNALSIILSKAFLLAADTKITDSTITRQIGESRMIRTQA